ncbi:u520, putative [Perkinsus marinus ATCC 50983]|uniref:U520, putative n=1 Tax=Perkinsus marinus (strain ATCC 50983 / TXsc) TaxID=423536 RepID=C5LWR0_PERM5|nr:u520, putative [Perkinsus marinus ATCC 50983]EEQ98855.1 u520, putative [Perkinsus marinus ATCC 50983]|eukprot:XP_002766138.1 u520, putative [Perkinsus marinus ATCC 50983]
MGGGDDDEDTGIRAGGEGDDADDGPASKRRNTSSTDLPVQKIHSHWLQRELGKRVKDSSEVIAVEKSILDVLRLPDSQSVENKLVQIFKYKHFDFCKILVNNRIKIWYCTKINQAQTPEERKSLEKEMEEDPAAAEVLEEWKIAHHHEDYKKLGDALDGEGGEGGGNRRKQLRSEARKLKEGEEEAASSLGHQEDGDVEMAEAGEIREAAKMPNPSKLVDLDSLQLPGGARFMSNQSFEPAKNTDVFTSSHKGYEEVVVQAPPKAKVKQESLIKVKEALPEWACPAFKHFERLNAVQSKVFPVAYNEFEENLLMCAPTGAGKTNVAMLTIMNVLKQYRTEDGFDTSAFKMVYIAPMKALVQEVVQSFSLRLGDLGLVVKELSGDQSLSREQIEQTNIIVTTPEKWDVVTRKAGESRGFTALVKLIIIDEIHLLHDNRGPVLEAIVARTLRQIEQTQEHVRLVGLSATLPNYKDVALFLRVNLNRGLFYFGQDYRPVPLDQTYVGVSSKKAIKRANVMNEVLFEKVEADAGKNQIIIFVHSRKDTLKTARELRDMAMEKEMLGKFLPESGASRQIIENEIENTIKSPDLGDLLKYGFGIHHAGMARVDRTTVEDLFADGHIQVLVSTLTLAWGVNLPAHTVIIKGTQVYSPEKGDWVELSPMDMMQMMGRAGRPQYDTTGHGIVITNRSELQYYLSLNNTQLPIESQMLSALPDMINAEMALGTIASRDDAVRWLGYTYLHVRMMKAPQLYGVPMGDEEGNPRDDPRLIQHRVNLCHAAMTMLDKNGLVKYDKRTGQCHITALGRVAAHYYIKYPSMAVYNQHLKPRMSDIELLRLFSLSSEFKYIPVREEEKVELSKLVEKVPIPVKGGAEETGSKINVLLQAYISRLPLDGFALQADMVYVEQSAGRIFRALFEIALRRGWADLAKKALLWSKVVEKRFWSVQTPLRHFKEIPEDILRKIEKKDIRFEQYYDYKPHEIGELLRAPKLGKHIYKYVHQFPKLDLAAYVQPITRSCLLVELTLTPDFQFDPKVHSSTEPFWIFVEDTQQETILYYELFVLRQSQADQEHTLTFTVPITDPMPPHYFIRCVSDRWIGAESLLPVNFRRLILPERNPPETELLDLMPLPITALKWPKAEQVFYGATGKLNPIQTQTFTQMFQSDDNTLLCAPANSGKLQCAEFAILRMLKEYEIKRCVYMCPFERLAELRLTEWQKKFGVDGLGCVVTKLTGEASQDLKLLDSSHIVITIPEHWDMISRRWRTRKPVQQVSLFIADDLHLLNHPRIGATMEACVSRMRYITSNLSAQASESGEAFKPCRIIGLAASISNANDLGGWMGAPVSSQFNFPTKIRAVPVKVIIHGYDIYSRNARMAAMTRPTYNLIKANSPSQPVVVFVGDRRQSRMVAADLMLQATADNSPDRFRHLSETAMKEHIEGLSKEYGWRTRERGLVTSLMHGIGYMHEGLSNKERDGLMELFESGAVQIMVVTVDLAWGLLPQTHNAGCRMVVVMDTVKYDARQRRYVDYDVADVVEMMSIAGRPGIDDHATCALLCPTTKKDYYKKFIYEPMPVESQLDQKLTDHLNAEVVSGTIENKQDAVDWLTWTFFYRRITRNPNYYSLQGVSPQEISDFLSEIIESTSDALAQTGCIEIGEDEITLSSTNLGMVAAYYYTRPSTIEIFSRNITRTSKRRALVEALCGASEFESIPVRPGEEGTLRALAERLKVPVETGKLKQGDPAVKCAILLHAHLARQRLPGSDLAADQRTVLLNSTRLIQAMVDVVASHEWYRVALRAMELSQMVVQAMGPDTSLLMQLPYINQDMVEEAKKMGVEDVLDILDLDDDKRNKLFRDLSESQVAEVAQACNQFPSINMEYKINKSKDGKTVTIPVVLERDGDLGVIDKTAGFVPVYAKYYPGEKEESWWLVAGMKDSLVAIRRVTINKAQVKAKLQFRLPEKPGKYNYTLCLMSDSFMGADHEYEVEVTV